MIQFGTTQAGKAVHALDLDNGQLTVRLLTLGSILNDVRLAGIDTPLTIGATDVAAYEGPLVSFGSIMGPVVNRIRNAKFQINGQTFATEPNFEGTHTLHSGSTGTHYKIWQVADYSDTHATLALDLPDGEGGFPGNRKLYAAWRLDGPSLTLAITATTDALTPMNPANHSYWTLGQGLGFCNHTLQVDADHILPADDTLMPTGAVAVISDTQWDARTTRTLAGSDEEFWDLNFCVSQNRRALQHVARLSGPCAQLDIATTEPGLQIYDCGTMHGADFPTHHGPPVRPYAGLAIEAQAWPGALEHDHFPSILLIPGETYSQTTRWTFTQS